MKNQKNDNDFGQPILWWKDPKLLLGALLVATSLIVGLYGKLLLLLKSYDPFKGITVWAFSWLILFAGAFLIGWETINLIKMRINHHVKKKVRDTYHYTKELRRKGAKKLAKTSKAIADKINK